MMSRSRRACVLDYAVIGRECTDRQSLIRRQLYDNARDDAVNTYTHIFFEAGINGLLIGIDFDLERDIEYYD